MMDARLQVTDPNGRRVVPLDKAVFIIGRRTAADLQLVNADVSREHAEIARDGVRFLLRDRGSRYGTFVNGEQVTERPLEHGDRIRLGRTDGIELVFMTDGSTTHVSGLRDAASDADDLRQMAAILNGLRALGSGRVLDEVLTLVLDSALDVTKAERGFVMLARADGELEFKIARGPNRLTLPGTSFTTSAKIPREVYLTGQSRIVGDLHGWEPGGPARRHDRHRHPPRAVRAAQREPDVGRDGRGRGAAGHRRALSRRPRAQHDAVAGDTLLARGVRDAGRAGHRERAALRGVRREGAPRSRPADRRRHPARAAARRRPTRAAPSTWRRRRSRAARSAATSSTISRSASAASGLPLATWRARGPRRRCWRRWCRATSWRRRRSAPTRRETMARINKALLRRAIEARFATMFYGAVGAAGALNYCNAGQEPPLVVREGQHRVARGRWPGARPAEYCHLRACVGDAGTRATSWSCAATVSPRRETSAGEEFGRDRLVAAMTPCHGGKPDAVLEQLLESVRRFSEGEPQGDDITALVLRYRGGGV